MTNYNELLSPMGIASMQLEQEETSLRNRSPPRQMRRSLFAKKQPEEIEDTTEVELDAGLHGRIPPSRSLVLHQALLGKSIGRFYRPTFRESLREFLREGKKRFYLEILNLVLSIAAFSDYLIQLYVPTTFVASPWRLALEYCVAIFFIFDLLVHLCAAEVPHKYLFSFYGLIDFVTIVPAVVLLIHPTAKVGVSFTLRVLRIFNALRLLRLKKFLRFKKKNRFDYELLVFVFSSIAVVLCAAGMYQAMDEDYYHHQNMTLAFHDALYFMLVTISTIGYGDISPKTTLSHFFVMVLIVAVLTIVPRKIAKLNELSKLNYAFDKEYQPQGRTSGHVVVYGSSLSYDTVLDFLHEFYHPSRGMIHLDVVFLSEKSPSKPLQRVLSSDIYRRKAVFLRGNLTNRHDRCRVGLSNATAVFLLGKMQFSRKMIEQQDAKTVLSALSIRNDHLIALHSEDRNPGSASATTRNSMTQNHHLDHLADPRGSSHAKDKRHIDVYMELLHDRDEHQVSSLLLGCNPLKARELMNMVLARTALCPGACALVLNLLRSVQVSEYEKYKALWGLNDHWPWIKEYVNGMSIQIYPIIFTRSFEGDTFPTAAKHIFKHYNSLLIAVHTTARRHQFNSNATEPHCANHQAPPVDLAPFQSTLHEGDIGFVLTVNASMAHHIVYTYGFWKSEATRKKKAASLAPMVRVCSDTLIRRASPRHRHYSMRSLRGSRNFEPDHVRSPSILAHSGHFGTHHHHHRPSGVENALPPALPLTIPKRNSCAMMPPTTNNQPLNKGISVHPIPTTPTPGTAPSSSRPLSPPVLSIPPMIDLFSGPNCVREQVEELLQSTIRRHAYSAQDHFILCGNFTPCMEVLVLLREYLDQETHAVVESIDSTCHIRSPTGGFVLLLRKLPQVDDLMVFLEQNPVLGSDFFANLAFVVGDASNTFDLVRVSACRAKRIIVLPMIQGEETCSSSSSSPCCGSESYGASRNSLEHGSTVAHEFDLVGEEEETNEMLMDYPVVKSLLAIEMAQRLPPVHNSWTASTPNSKVATPHPAVSPPKLHLSARRASLHASLHGIHLDTGDTAAASSVYSYERELEQGLPKEIVHLRLLERFPELDPNVFQQPADAINAAINEQKYHIKMQQQRVVRERSGASISGRPIAATTPATRHRRGERDGGEAISSCLASGFGHNSTGPLSIPAAAECIIAVLHYASNIKFCRVPFVPFHAERGSGAGDQELLQVDVDVFDASEDPHHLTRSRGSPNELELDQPPTDVQQQQQQSSRKSKNLALHDEFPWLSGSFAAGNLFFCNVLDRLLCQIFYNPYILDVIYALTNGSGGTVDGGCDHDCKCKCHDATSSSSSCLHGFASPVAGACGDATSGSSSTSWTPGSTPYRRLFQVSMDSSFAERTFEDAFEEYLAQNLLIIAIWRFPNEQKGNLLPFVITCPPKELPLCPSDRFFVLG